MSWPDSPYSDDPEVERDLEFFFGPRPRVLIPARQLMAEMEELLHELKRPDDEPLSEDW